MSQRFVRRFIATTVVLAAAPAAAGTQTAQAFETLERGDRGKDVRLVQRALTAVGIRTAADGVFGAGTVRNVIRYERREDIRVDGRVSRGQARGLLRRAGMDTGRLDRGRAASRGARAFKTLERGDRGPEVRLVQRALTAVGIRTVADGVYGLRTARRVIRYERRVDIRVDGRVSRGQARGLLRRADMDPDLVDEAAARSGDEREKAPSDGTGPGSTFPVQGPHKLGVDGEGRRFGEGGHDGEDVMADCGTPLVAAESGTVAFTGSHEVAGNYVVIRSAASGEDHVYIHLLSPTGLAKGDGVETGARIGEVGETGNASACHLHFELWTAPGWYEGGSPRDPMPDLRRWRDGEAS